MVAKNRGASVEIFHDETEAHAWLKQFQHADPGATA
jgi:hypothetical protein